MTTGATSAPAIPTAVGMATGWSVVGNDVAPLPVVASVVTNGIQAATMQKEAQPMGQANKSIDVKVPVSTAYNQWTQFESFPMFMEGVNEVRQLDDKRLHWVATIAGKTEEWDAEITEQHPDHRVAWTSTTGDRNAGVVTFHRIDDETTRLNVQIDYEPSGPVEKVGDWLGMLDRRVQGDLERFKEFIETRGTETGAWRGEIEEQPQA
jgi:uncharacterized membrane protein